MDTIPQCRPARTGRLRFRCRRTPGFLPGLTPCVVARAGSSLVAGIRHSVCACAPARTCVHARVYALCACVSERACLKWNGAASGQGRCAPAVRGIRHTTTPCGQRRAIGPHSPRHADIRRRCAPRGAMRPSADARQVVRVRLDHNSISGTYSLHVNNSRALPPRSLPRPPPPPHWTGRAQPIRSKSRVVRVPHAVAVPYESSSALASRIHRRSLAPVDAQRAPRPAQPAIAAAAAPPLFVPP